MTTGRSHVTSGTEERVTVLPLSDRMGQLLKQEPWEERLGRRGWETLLLFGLFLMKIFTLKLWHQLGISLLGADILSVIKANLITLSGMYQISRHLQAERGPARLLGEGKRPSLRGADSGGVAPVSMGKGVRCGLPDTFLLQAELAQAIPQRCPHLGIYNFDFSYLDL